MIRDKDGAKRYVAKYAGKPHQKEVPEWYWDVGRFWGNSRGVKENREKPQIYMADEDTIREMLHEQGKGTAQWDVLPKYLWGFDPKGLEPVNLEKSGIDLSQDLM
jgi:hypothetical protein